MMNEKDSLNDILMQEKEMIKTYGTFLPEGSTSQIRNIMKKNMDVLDQQQYEVFNVMKQRGYYNVNEAQSKQINDVKNMYS